MTDVTVAALTADEIAAMRNEHAEGDDGHCVECQYRYPCFTIRALNALDAAQRRVAALAQERDAVQTEALKQRMFAAQYALWLDAYGPKDWRSFEMFADSAAMNAAYREHDAAMDRIAALAAPHDATNAQLTITPGLDKVKGIRWFPDASATAPAMGWALQHRCTTLSDAPEGNE